LAQKPLLIAPGVYDAMTALLAEQAGFEAIYLSGASIAYARLGRPDIGLVDRGEVAETVAAIAERVSLPLIVDADTGFGNALNVQRTVRSFERAGAAAIQLEDQRMPKRCGHLKGKALVSKAEMVGKIAAAVDARRKALVVARTDAIAVEGFDAALERADAYVAAGADVLFVEAPASRDQMAEIGRRFSTSVPLLANMVEGGTTPLLPAGELEALGFALAIYPGGTMRASAFALGAYFASLKAAGSTLPWRDKMLDFAGLNALIGTDATLALGARYDEGRHGDKS
jgi:2-methylisocitrate lyase-like PEP mutase family enzyme